MVDVVLYPYNATPNDVILRSPVQFDGRPGGVSVTSSFSARRSLYYQAAVNVIVIPTVVVAFTNFGWHQPLSAAPRKPTRQTQQTIYTPGPPEVPAVTADVAWLQPFSIGAAGTPPYLPKSDHVTPPFLPITVEARGGTSVTTSQVSNRTLYYQSKIEPLPQPTAAAVVVATIEWVQPFSTMPPSRFVVRQNVPFVPPPVLQVTADEWLQPFQRRVAAPLPVHTQPILGAAPAPQVTADEWLQPFQKAVPTPRARYTQPVSGYQPEAVVSNLTTSIEWLQPFYRAAPQPRPAQSQPVFGYPYESVVVSNLTTTLEWQIAWKGPPRYLQPLAGGPVYPGTPSNLTTTLEWQIAWQKAVLPSKPIHTQPVYPATPSNLTTTLEWQIAWQGAKPTKPTHTQPFFNYPYLALPNLTTTLEWLQPFYKAAIGTKPIPSQPVWSYQYVETPPPVTLTTTLEWLVAWQGPPRYTPLRAYPYQPFVPSTLVIDNTITGIAWHQPFSRQLRRKSVVTFTSPQFVPTAFAQFPTAWHVPLSRAPVRYRAAYQQTVRADAVTVDNTVTIEKWQQPFHKAARIRWPAKTNVLLPAYPYVTAAVDNNVTIDKWLVPFGSARAHWWPRYEAFTYPTSELPAVVVPPVVVTKGWTTEAAAEADWTTETPAAVTWTVEGTVSATWATELPGVCADDIVSDSAFQDDAFQQDAFQVVGEATAVPLTCWVVEADVENEWTEEEPDP